MISSCDMKCIKLHVHACGLQAASTLSCCICVDVATHRESDTSDQHCVLSFKDIPFPFLGAVQLCMADAVLVSSCLMQDTLDIACSFDRFPLDACASNAIGAFAINVTSSLSMQMQQRPAIAFGASDCLESTGALQRTCAFMTLVWQGLGAFSLGNKQS